MERMGIPFALLILLLGLVGPSVAQNPGPPIASVSGPAGPATITGLPLAHWPGPDGYGYRGTSAPYAWVDIRATGTRIAITGDDQCSGALPIGFSFPFYGAVYTTFYAQTNGTLSFTPTTDFSNDCLLPDARAPDNVIALAWDDLYMDRAAWARYQTFPTCPAGPATACLVVTFANMDTIAGQTAGTWQALLYPSGEVRLQYQDAGQAAGASYTTGIEGADFLANHGLTYACEVAGSLAPSTTVRFYAPPLLLLPEEAAYDACRLEWQDHHLEAVNRTLLSATLTLTYTVAGPAEVSGPVSLGPLPGGGSQPFTVSVRLTEAAGLSTTVVVTVIARAQETGVTATAQIAQRAAAAHLDHRWQVRPAGTGLYWGASYYDPANDAVCFVDGLTGQSPNIAVANVHACYNPATGSWSTRAPAPVPVFAPAYGWIDGRFYLAGGFTTTAFTATRQVQVYDPAADAWSWGALMPTARGGAAGGVVDGKLYAAGGSGTGIYPLDCPTYAYDPALNTWTSRAACPLQGGYGLFLGGGVGSDTASRLFAGGHFDAHYGWHAYDPAANTWAARAGLPGLVHRTPLFVERDGDVYMVGGLTGWTPAARVYHYDPAADAWDALPPLLHTPTGGSLGPAHGSFGSPAHGGFWSYGGTAGSGALPPVPHEQWSWVTCAPLNPPAVTVGLPLVVRGQPEGRVEGPGYGRSNVLAAPPQPAHADPDHLQETANGAALKGVWVMVDYAGSSPATDILYRVNVTGQGYGIPDTNGNPDDIVNDNILAYYVYFDGSCVPLGPECWELHGGPNVIPAGAKGLHVEVTLPIAGASLDLVEMTSTATASATATYNPMGGIVPIAANEYWTGSQGICPYDHCGEPYSFGRDPGELPPFESTDGGLTWARNVCPDPYNDNICQGPYDGAGENYGRAFALLGADAVPNHGSMVPRGAVELDSRYNALVDGGDWYFLIYNDIWDGPNTHAPVSDGEGRDSMVAVIRAGGYAKTPLARAVHEPPIPYVGQWAYCWEIPRSEDNCFNYPESGRSSPYDTLQLLSGVSAITLAQAMYDHGHYQDRYGPGARIVVAVYNGYAANLWGTGGDWADAAVLVGYAGATIVGYGSTLASPCNGTPGDWQSYEPCVQGPVNTVYALVDGAGALVIDPSRLLNEWLSKRVGLIRGPWSRASAYSTTITRPTPAGSKASP